jgi:glycosyltransferase involved in cell wall biosynthesis
MRNLEITIDGRPLVGNRTGIGVHTAEIAGRLEVDPPPLIASQTWIEDRGAVERCRFQVDPAPNGILWQQFILPRVARSGVLWGPHGTIPLALRIPSVVTLHDFTSITMPGRHLLKTVLSFNLFIGRSLERAAKIAAVSRAIADEAMRSFGVPAAKIEIVPNGVDEFFSPAERRPEVGGRRSDAQASSDPRPPIPDPYILYVGTLEPRKGLEDLLFAWNALPATRPRLVLAGDTGWGRASQRLRDRAADEVLRRSTDIEFTGFVTRERLRELYRGATAFVYPSHFEGFGIPPLEAMACGAPVIATRTGAIPEYADDAAMLVGPRDREALAATLRRLLDDESLRRDLRARGPERARLYRWDRSAALMTEIFAEAVR